MGLRMLVRAADRMGTMAKKSRTTTTTNERTKQPEQDVVCVDLFCGAGGLTHGLVDAGVRVVAASAYPDVEGKAVLEECGVATC